jgi:hypothetical protein
MGPAVPVLLIGAGYDSPATTALSTMLRADGTEHSVLIDRPPAEVIDILRRSAFYMGFQSGLNVLADNLDVPQLMLYYAHLDRMRYTWCKPANRDNGTFRAALFSHGAAEAVGAVQAMPTTS